MTSIDTARDGRFTLRFCLATFSLVSCLYFGSSSRADVSLPNIFSDHMVLQQKQANRMWGKGDPGEKVTVTFDGKSKDATTGEDGTWQVMLDPAEVGDPRELVVEGKNKIQIRDVLVGEVWICSGQSNMEWPMQATYNFDLEKLAADYPQIRMINYPNVAAQEPVFTHPDAKWMVCNEKNLGGFSAVGYYFGLQLYRTLKVPVGLVNNSWGGSACESWVPREKLAGNEILEPMLTRADEVFTEFKQLSAVSDPSGEQKKHLENLRRQVNGNQLAANLYNGILKSHLGYGIRGAIWYQGETNAGRSYQYRELFPTMISHWREEWGQGDFPFYWVQLADFMQEKEEPGDSGWAELREAQTMTMDKLPNTGEAVIIDVGEGKDIHPRNKHEVGLRLSRWALADVYGIEVPHHSPRFEAMQIDGSKAVLSFQDVDGGWRPFDVPDPVGFTVAGEDKKFYLAQAKIVGDNKIEVWSDKVETPVAVRYAWADNPRCNMYDGAGLPLTPFRTDDWPGVTVNAR